MNGLGFKTLFYSWVWNSSVEHLIFNWKSLKIDSCSLNFKEQNRVPWTRFVRFLTSFKTLLTNEIVWGIWLYRKKKILGVIALFTHHGSSIERGPCHQGSITFFRKNFDNYLGAMKSKNRIPIHSWPRCPSYLLYSAQVRHFVCIRFTNFNISRPLGMRYIVRRAVNASRSVKIVRRIHWFFAAHENHNPW